MALEVFKLMGTIAINKEQALRDIKAVQNQAERASKEMGRSFAKFTTDHSAQFRKMGMVATVVGGVITFAVKKMGDAFDKYESALVDMGKITDESLESIENRMKELPPILGSLTELTRGYYQIVSAGIRDPIEAVDTLTVSSQTAAAAHMNQSEVVKGLTKVMAGYEGEIKDVSEAADLMFAIEKAGQTTVAELIPLIGGLATMSSNLKISQIEMGASFAVITRTAGSSAEAATEYEGVLTGLMKPTDEMIKAINKMGFETASLAIEELGLVEVLRRLVEPIGDNEVALGKLFGRKQALLGISKLTSGEMGVLSDAIDLVAEKGGMADQAFKDWTTTGEAFNKEQKAVTENLIALLGKAIDPMMDVLQRRLIVILTNMGEWISKNEELAASLTTLGGGAGMALIPFGVLMMMLPGLVIALPKIIGFIGLLSDAFAAWAISLGVSMPILAGIIVGTGAIIKLTYDWIEAIKEGKAIKEMEIKSAEAQTKALEGLQRAYGLTEDELGKVAENMKEGKGLLEGIRGPTEEVTKVTKSLQEAYNLTNEEMDYWLENHKMAPSALQKVKEATYALVESEKELTEAVKESAKSLEERDATILDSIIRGKELSEQQEEYMALRQRMSDIDRTATQRKIDDLDRECIALIANMETNLMTQEQIDEYRQVMRDHIIAESSERQEHLRNIEEIETRLFELTHTQTESRIRDLELERDARVEAAKQAMLSAEELEVAVSKFEEIYEREKDSILELAVVRKEQEIAGIDEAIKKRKEAGESIDDLIEKRSEAVEALKELYEKQSAAVLEVTIASSKAEIESLNKAIAYRTNTEVSIDSLIAKRNEEIANLARLKEAYSGTAKEAEKLVTAEQKKPYYKKIDVEGNIIGFQSQQQLSQEESAAGVTLVPMAGGGLIETFMKVVKFLAKGGSTDTVPIMATPGEYLIKKEYVDFVRKTGMVTGGLVEAIRRGLPTPSPPQFAGGGMVWGSSRGIGETAPLISSARRTGGWTYTINFINPVVRDDEDLANIKDLMKEALDENADDLDLTGNEIGV